MAFTHVHGFSVNINLCLGAKEHGKLLKEPFKIRELEPILLAQIVFRQDLMESP
jgi:hypothetical protein